MEVAASILDPVQQTLSPFIWEHPEAPEPFLKPKVANYIRRTIYGVLEHHGYSDPHEWLRLCLTGSLTTYQYADDSDCDLSLFVDSKAFPEWSRSEMIGLMISDVDGGQAVIPGTPYPLQCFVVARRFQPTDLFKPGLRSGYDIDHARWIVPPDKGHSHNIQAQEYGAYAYGLQMADKMERLLRYEPAKAEQFWHQIHARRMRDQTAGKGDFSDANIVYKFLAKRGLLPEIAQLTGEHIAAAPVVRHNLTWQPGGPGKGFVLQDGSIWTWPTQNMRPIHHSMETRAGMDGAAPVKRGTEFHIEPHGRVWQYNRPDIPGESPGYRSFDPDDRFNIVKANGGLWFGRPGDEAPPNVVDNGYGHATELMPQPPVTAASKEAWGPTEQLKGLMTGDRPKATSPLLRPKWQRQRIDRADRTYESAWSNYGRGWEQEHGLWQSPGSYYPREDSQDYLYRLWQRKYEEREGDHGDVGGSDWRAAIRPKAQEAWPAEMAQRHQGLLQAHQDTATKMYQNGLIDQPRFEQAAQWGMQKAQQLGHDPTTFALDPVAQAERAPVQLDPTPELHRLPQPTRTAMQWDDAGNPQPVYQTRPGERALPPASPGGDTQAMLDANAGQDLYGLPGRVKVPGYGPLEFHSNADIQRVAHEYNQANGLGEHPTDYVPVNPQRAGQIAAEYERMPHNPQDPRVAQAYRALAQESMAQYQHAVNNGYQFEFYPEGQDPYPKSPREAVMDLHRNKHMYVYPTEAGYGQDQQGMDHPLLQDSGERWGGRPVTYNDIFRGIHDFYGHAKEGVGFRAHGEDNAYRQHAAMFSPAARQALASETRGQNSFVNFGPHGQTNQTANQAETVYAPQKAGLLPEWVSGPSLHQQSTFARTAASDVANTAYQATVSNGGITVGLDGSQPTAGFAYSPAKSEESIVPLDKLTPDDIDHFIVDHYSLLNQPGHYLGMWVDGPDVYLDLSVVNEDRSQAFQGAQGANQLAMYDLSNFDEIPVLKRGLERVW